MTNAEKPAFPIPKDRSIESTSLNGLTKYEHAVITIVAGIKANAIPGSHHIPKNTVKEAIELADIIFAELENKK